MIVVDEGPRRCARCGHASLLLFVFAEGLVRRARFGCACYSVLLHRDEAEQVMQERRAPTLRYVSASETRSAS